MYYLNSFESRDFQPINDFIITELKEYPHPVIIKNLVFLENLNLINNDQEMNYHLNSWVKYGTTSNNPDIFNGQICSVKITDKGRSMINDIDLSKKSSMYKTKKSWKSIFKNN